jgi:hypothetical protein
MINLLSLHKALTMFSLRVAAFAKASTTASHMAGRPTHKHTKDLRSVTYANQHPSFVLHIVVHRKLCCIPPDHIH